MNFTAGAGIILYFVYIDSMLLAIPGVFPKINGTLFYQHVHQVSLIQLSTLMVLLPDTALLTIGFYFFAVLNIFSDIIQDLDKVESSKKKQFLIHIHKIHCDILNKFKLFGQVFFFTFTIQIATSVVFVLSVFFLMYNEKSVAFIPLLLVVFGEFGTLCIFGEFIYSKTERFSTELYLTKWYECSLEEQKILFMIMHISQKPFGIKAAGMYDINLVMFIDVVKAGVSFCALLYTLA